MSEAELRRIWRACGLVEPSPGTPCASDADIEAMRAFKALSEVLGVEATLGLARVVGSSLSRIGEALSAAVRGNADDLNLALTNSELVTARSFAFAAGLVGPAGRAIDTLFRHHIESARALFEEAVEADPRQQISMGVGFIDLCDYTALSGQLDPEKLAHLLTRFEEIAFDVAADTGARVVKFLGDAVMFVAPDPAIVVDTAVGLMNHPEACGSGLSARGGVAYGVMLAQDGDFFGPPVNLAARLVAAAEPNVLLLAPDVVARLDSSWPLEQLPDLQLRGISAPVRASALRPMTLLSADPATP